MSGGFPAGYKAADFTLLAHSYFSNPGMPADGEYRLYTAAKPVDGGKTHIMTFVSPRENTDTLDQWFVLSTEVTGAQMQTLGWRPEVTRVRMLDFLGGVGAEPVEYFRSLRNDRKLAAGGAQPS